jgi:uncharacterized membrane protein
MATKSIARGGPRKAASVPIRNITHEDLSIALRQGLDDFLTFRGDIVFAGLVYTVIGIAAVVMTASAGFYELARRREAGETDVHWFNFLDVLKRPSIDDMGIVAGLLLLIFFVWLLAAGALYAALFNWATPTSIPQFMAMVFTTPQGWALIVGGAVIGAIFGWIVLALSVVSIPMLVDRNVSAAKAVSASWRAAHANKGEMIRWGIIVLGLLIVGSIPLFVGLAFVLPWLGYSTWHLYTRLIDREALRTR